MSETTFNRQESLDRTRKEDERSDLKQHADKMLRDFENFNIFSSNRAIWELVQNACDLSVDCEITIDYRNEKIAFTHNGKPFTSKSLISLIKQVSGKYGDQEDIPEVGKYGTGFLTTHTFGRTFEIDSYLDENGSLLPLSKFKIDRSPKTWELLSDNISDQKKKVYEIIEKEEIVHPITISTTFTYSPNSDIESDYVKVSSLDLEEYIPLVFTVNERLKKVTVINRDGVSKTYTKASKTEVENIKGINIFKTIVTANDTEKWIYSLIDLENQIEIILPIAKDNTVFKFSERIARLFLYYPLVGSEEFGINFLINCNQFLPNEPRSGVHLKSNKEQIKDQEKANRLILERATNLIFAFLESNIIEVANPLLYSDVNFNAKSEDTLLNEYFSSLQNEWNLRMSTLSFVKTSEGYKQINQATYFGKELLLDDENDLKTIYNIASKYYKLLPVFEDVLEWSSYAENWNDINTTFINHQDILEKIAEEQLSDFDEQNLLEYFSYLIANGRSNFFNELTLLPNINGNFHKLGHLWEYKNLDSQLIRIGRILIPDVMENLVDPKFVFDFDFSVYNRKDFSNSVKLALDAKNVDSLVYIKEEIEEGMYHQDLLETQPKLDSEFFIALLDFCKLNANIHSVSKPSQMVNIISKYFGLEQTLLVLPKVGNEAEELENRSIRKVLVKVFFNLLGLHTSLWVEQNLELLANICVLEDDSYKEVYKTSKIYPNQLFELHRSENLKRDIDVWKDIKDIYQKVKKEDINEKLVVRSFNDFIPDEQFVNNKYLTVQIEEVFFQNAVSEIDEHPFKDVIISIIPKLTKKHYQDLFPQLDSKKANIMISVVTKEETKDDIFAIVTLKDDKLKKLGELVRKENFLDLLEKAEQMAMEEENKHFDFQHKYAIGTYIEDKIREKLGEELRGNLFIENVSSDNVQGGQDIVIKLNENTIHFIEVKSRWDSRNSVTMSKLQLERAATNLDMYSLCSVDVSSFFGEGDKYRLDIEQIIPLTRFVNKIGGDIKPLVEYNLTAEKNIDEKVHLIEYRGIVPQSIIKTGDDFSSFINYLTEKIKKTATNAITN